jgi:hypothetical protein
LQTVSKTSRILAGGALVFLLSAATVSAQTALDESSPWPRVRSTNGCTATIFQPQVENWTHNSFTGRAAVELKMPGEKSASMGVVWFDANGSVDPTNRVVVLDHFDITRVNFPDAKDGGSNALAVMRQVVPSGARTVSLDYLVTALGFDRAAAREGLHGYSHTPPEIIWATNRTVLILIDGEPVLRPVTGSNLQRVINTPALLVKCEEKYFLAGGGHLFVANSVAGPWSLSQMPPPEVAALVPKSEAEAAASSNEPLPRILVRTRPAELVATVGPPDFRPIAGTSLKYAANTDSQLFFDSTNREAYVLLSGRWFKAGSLNGPWSYVTPHALPDDFAKIPPNSPQGIVLASVPGTPQAEAALLALMTPTTATVSRRDAKIQVEYDGEPQFKPITGTDMTYAVNAQVPVILADGTYYAIDNAVWFTSKAPTGPWEVATEIPDKIYTIPPDSPLYYTTFARVYEATNDVVEVGYTPGYEGAYEDDDTVVYGTGCEYEPYYGSYYYSWGWSWGYGYVYVPWYNWWVWRDWWDHPGALRSAVKENIYERWREGDHVVPHDRLAAAAVARRAEGGLGNYPTLYGRFRNGARAAALSPPANTLALNPYVRPQGAPKPGEIPRGATLLTTVRQSPGGGRDIYATQDGQVYLRKNDGWYQRQGGNWNYVAALQGAENRGRVGTGARAANLPNVQYTPRQSVTTRLPDSGAYARQVNVNNNVSAMEREHAARALAQQRQQNVQASRNINRQAPASRPNRSFGGGGRRGR